MSRRARVTPERAGIPTGTDRRVPGLRRTEVAMLAGVSVEYYTRVERGSIAGVSDSVLEAIASALQLDEAERGHLFNLARAASGSSVVRRRTRGSRGPALRPGLQAALDAITAGPAFVRNGRMDLLGTNLLGRAFYDDVYAMGDPVPNLARFCFLSDAARPFYPDWDAAADVTVSILHAEAGRDPRDKDLHDLIGNCRPAVRSSAPSGPRTTSAATVRGPRSSTTPSWVTSPSPTRGWKSPKTRDCNC